MLYLKMWFNFNSLIYVRKSMGLFCFVLMLLLLNLIGDTNIKLPEKTWLKGLFSTFAHSFIQFNYFFLFLSRVAWLSTSYILFSDFLYLIMPYADLVVCQMRLFARIPCPSHVRPRSRVPCVVTHPVRRARKWRCCLSDGTVSLCLVGSSEEVLSCFGEFCRSWTRTDRAQQLSRAVRST